MTANDYCLERIGGPGSDRYYALWHLPPGPRDALTALHALAAEIADVPRECREPQLAQLKLAWWREEIARASHDRASHPATKILAPWLLRTALPVSSLLPIVDATVADIGPVRIARFDDLRAHCRDRAGAVAALAAGLLGARDPATLDCARELGGLNDIARTLVESGGDLRAGRVYLPVEELRQFGLVEGALLDAGESDAWRDFITRQVDRLTQHYRDTLARVPQAAIETLRPELIIAALQQALLAEVRASGYRVLVQRVTLTPLRRLWIAWRTGRRVPRSKPAPPLG